MKIRSLLYIFACVIPALANANLQTADVVDPAEEAVSQPTVTAATTLAKLDLDGYFLIYLDIDGIIKPLREEMLALAAKLDEVAEEGSTEKLAISNATEKVDPLLEWAGLYSLQSYGASLALTGKGETRSKGFAQFDENIDKTVLRRLVGAPSTLQSRYFMPENTAFAVSGTLSISGLWEVVKEVVVTFGEEAAKQQFETGIFSLKEGMGIDLDALLATIDNECFISIQLNEEQPVVIPIPAEEVFEIPAPTIMIGLKVTDSSLYDTVTNLLTMTGMPTTELTIAGVPAVSIQLPMPSPVEVLPTVMMYDGYLLIASTPALMEEAVASYVDQAGLVKTEAFQARLGDIPEQITSLSYAGNSFYRVVTDITKKAVIMQTTADPEDQLIAVLQGELARIIESRSVMEAAGYEVWDEEGLYSENNIKSDSNNIIFEGLRQPIFAAILGAVEGMQAQKQQEKILQECMENLSAIDRAKLQWAEDNDYPAEAPTPEDLEPYIEGGFPICPMGGYYEINEVDMPATCDIHSF